MADLKVSGNITGGGVVKAPTGEFDNLNTKLNQKQDKLNASSISTGTVRSGVNDTVIEYKVNSNMSSWYRIWASGWKECGGFYNNITSYSTGTRDITLPISFSSKYSYTTTANVCSTDYDKSYLQMKDAELWFYTPYIQQLSSNKITIATVVKYVNSDSMPITYRCEGY